MNFSELIIGESLQHIDESKTKSRAIILNTENQILLTKYAGVYMLPGGKVDEGESPDDAIYREIKEETGLEFPKLQPLKKLKYYKLADIETLLEENKTSNPRTPFFNNETRTIIECYMKDLKNELLLESFTIP